MFSKDPGPKQIKKMGDTFNILYSLLKLLTRDLHNMNETDCNHFFAIKTPFWEMGVLRNYGLIQKH
jgi:hypothetical protein